jgi:hypothetical protein
MPETETTTETPEVALARANAALDQVASHTGEISRLERRLVDSYNRNRWSVAVLGADILLVFFSLAKRINRLEAADTGMTSWDKRRLEQLEQMMHLHLHPEEYTHR